MLTDSSNIFEWWYLLLLLLPAIYYGIKIFDRLTQKERTPSSAPRAQRGIDGLLSIEQREPGRRPPLIISILSLISAFLLLLFGGASVYLWIAGTVKFELSFPTFLFLVILIIFPLFTIIQYFVIDRRYYRLGRSHVAKEAKVTFSNDPDTVFDACHRVLASIQATIKTAKKPRLLKARIGDSVMTIKIKRIKGSRVRIYVLSDSKWLTTRWDRGANQRNIDRFLQELSRH
jgi:hypothetical protein